MVKPVLCSLLLLAACALAQSGSPDAAAQEAKLVVLEHLWNNAQIHRDSHALEALIADRFVNTEYDGEVSEPDRFLGGYQGSGIQAERYEYSRRESERISGYGRGDRDLSRKGNVQR
jgi:hypothetical protein